MNSTEQYLKTKDLIYIVLRSWRRLTIFALIGAILFVGFAIYRGGVSGEPSVTAIQLTDKEKEEITKKVTQNHPEILERKSRIESLENRSSFLSKRLANSVYLAISADAQPIVKYDVLVSPEQVLPGSQDTYEQRQHLIAMDLLRATEDEKFFVYLVNHCAHCFEPEWISELVKLRGGEKGILHVEITAPDLSVAEDLADSVQDYLATDIRQHLSAPYLFDLSISNRISLTKPNPEIRLAREAAEEELARVRLAIIEQQEAIEVRIEAELEQALEEKVQEAKEAWAHGTSRIGRRTLIKYAIVGIVLGFLISAFSAIMRVTSSTAIWSPEEYANRVNQLFIGNYHYPVMESRSSFGSGLDRRLEGLFYRNKRAVLNESKPIYLASIISSLAGKYPKQEKTPYVIALMNDDPDIILDELTASIGRNEALTIVNVSPKTIEGINVLETADGLIQVLRARKTKLPSALHDLELASKMGIKVLGILGVETAS